MVKRLQQEARDGVEEKKIGERKSVAMVSFMKSQGSQDFRISTFMDSSQFFIK